MPSVRCSCTSRTPTARTSPRWSARSRSNSKSTPRFSQPRDRKSTRLNSSHSQISYAVFCLKKKKKINSIYYISIEKSSSSLLANMHHLHQSDNRKTTPVSTLIRHTLQHEACIYESRTDREL